MSDLMSAVNLRTENLLLSFEFFSAPVILVLNASANDAFKNGYETLMNRTFMSSSILDYCVDSEGNVENDLQFFA